MGRRKRGANSLAVLLQAFCGMEVVLELKTDVEVLGVVDWADGAMKYAVVRACAPVCLVALTSSCPEQYYTSRCSGHSSQCS